MTARSAESGVANGMDMAAKHVVWPAPAQLLECRGRHVGRRPGCRVSVGPRGTYSTLAPAAYAILGASISLPRLRRAPPHSDRPVPAQPALPGRSVEILDPRQLVDTSPDELLDEIRRKPHITGSSPLF